MAIAKKSLLFFMFLFSVNARAQDRWQPVPRADIRPGLEAMLAVAGDKSDPSVKVNFVIIAMSLHTAKETKELVGNGDKESLDRIARFLKQGRLVSSDFGIKVKVTEVLEEEELVEIEINSGQFKGRKGYVGPHTICTKIDPNKKGFKQVPVNALKRGYVGYLGFPGDDPSSPGIVIIPINDTVMARMLKYSQTIKNNEELQKVYLSMVVDGTAFTPAKGTKVKVLQVKNGTLDVQILDGNFKSRKAVILDYNLCTK